MFVCVWSLAHRTSEGQRSFVRLATFQLYFQFTPIKLDPIKSGCFCTTRICFPAIRIFLSGMDNDSRLTLYMSKIKKLSQPLHLMLQSCFPELYIPHSSQKSPAPPAPSWPSRAPHAVQGGSSPPARPRGKAGPFRLVDSFASRNKCIASSNKCLTGSNKKLVITILIKFLLLLVVRHLFLVASCYY